MKKYQKLSKQILAAVMVCILIVSSTGILTVLASEENANEEVVDNQEGMEEEASEEINVEENSTGFNENFVTETERDVSDKKK